MTAPLPRAPGYKAPERPAPLALAQPIRSSFGDCILTEADGEDATDCSTHAHVGFDRDFGAPSDFLTLTPAEREELLEEEDVDWSDYEDIDPEMREHWFGNLVDRIGDTMQDTFIPHSDLRPEGLGITAEDCEAYAIVQMRADKSERYVLTCNEEELENEIAACLVEEGWDVIEVIDLHTGEDMDWGVEVNVVGLWRFEDDVSDEELEDEPPPSATERAHRAMVEEEEENKRIAERQERIRQLQLEGAARFGGNALDPVPA